VFSSRDTVEGVRMDVDGDGGGMELAHLSDCRFAEQDQLDAAARLGRIRITHRGIVSGKWLRVSQKS